MPPRDREPADEHHRVLVGDMAQRARLRVLRRHLRVFARAYDRIVEAAEKTPRPFVYWVRKDGRLEQEYLS